MACDFFFSSRRRHTRCYRDWSSDVCSSDLPRAQSLLEGSDVQGYALAVAPARRGILRSEERRVGKECRWRLSGGARKEKHVTLARCVMVAQYVHQQQTTQQTL